MKPWELTPRATTGTLFTHSRMGPEMPEVSRFYGIVIKVFFRDHPPPHFHAVYAEHQALYDMQTLEVIEGDLPRTAAKLVVEWARLNQESLIRIWDTQEFAEIPPLE